MTDAVVALGLTKRFGSFVAVDSVDFAVARGEIFGWLGANGAGKSTTMRMLIGALAPSAGDGIVAGCRVSTDPLGVRARIGYMSQKFSLYPDLTVRQNLVFFGGAYGLAGRALQARIDALVTSVDLGEWLDANTGTLPGGTRQRVALAASMLHAPEVVFLDEPTAGVDPLSRRRFWELIRRVAADGVAVFVTTHHLDEAEGCDRVGLMVDGKLVALDTPAGLAHTWVPGELWRLSGAGIHAAVPGLAARPGVLAVEPFGAGAHLRVDGVNEATIRSWLSPDVTVERTRATLEDVFLAVVGRKAAA